MLPQGQGGVVDPRLRVYGIQGLRIVDASIFPVIPDANIQVCIILMTSNLHTPSLIGAANDGRLARLRFTWWQRKLR